MDMTATVHAVAAISATSRELAQLWRLMTGSGPTMALSGRIMAVAWMGSLGPRIHATSKMSDEELRDLLWALDRDPTCRYMLVQHGKRVKLVVFQRREEVAAGRILQPRTADSPLVITGPPREREQLVAAH